VVLRKDITNSPFWLLPVVRNVISPEPGLLLETRA